MCAPELQVQVLRGEDQIGGNLILATCGKNKILLDAGDALDGTPAGQALLSQAGHVDAILATHYHPDHLGLAYQLPEQLPLYMGRSAWEIQKTVDRYLGRTTLEPTGFLTDGQPLQLGNLTVTPYLCDHSAFDSYMLLVEGGGKSLLYTGDFRGHGRKSFAELLNKLPQNVDTLICEGTALSCPEDPPWSEQELEDRAVERIMQVDGPVFVLLSATNLDRVVTFYQAAKRTGRVFLEDLYLAEVAAAAGKSLPQPWEFPDVRIFITGYHNNHPFYQRFLEYGWSKIGRNQITPGSVICVRSSMLSWIRKLGERMDLSQGLLFYSLWSGYRETENMARFLNGCQALGISIQTLHTSGHAGRRELQELIHRVQPKTILPVHTLCPEWFSEEPEE